MASKYAKSISRSTKRTRSRHLVQQEDNLSDGDTSDVEFIGDKPAQPTHLYSAINKVNHISDDKDENRFSSLSPSVKPTQLESREFESEGVLSSSSSLYEHRKRKRLSSVIFTQPTKLEFLTDFHTSLTPEQSALNYVITNLKSPAITTQVPVISSVWPPNFISENILSNIDYFLANHVDKTIKEFTNLDSKVSLLLKMFTVFDENRECVSFIAIIATWLDEKMKFNELLLDFSLCKAVEKDDESFIYEVAKAIFESLEEYRILQKVFVITYDYQNIEIEKEVLSKAVSDFYNGQRPKIVMTYSLASAIDSIAINFMQSLDIEAWSLAKQYDYSASFDLQSLDSKNEWRCIDCIRCILLYYSDSTAKQNEWLSFCGDQNIKKATANHILLDNPSDWLSTYQMLSHSLLLRKAFNKATSQDDLVSYKIDYKDWEKIEQIVKLFHILKNFSELLNTQQPLLNLSALTIWKIKDILYDIKTLKGPFANFRIDLCKKFEMAFGEYEQWVLSEDQWPDLIFQFASILDPRQVCTTLSEYCLSKDVNTIMIEFENFISQYKLERQDTEFLISVNKLDPGDPFNGELFLENPSIDKKYQAPMYLSREPIRYKSMTESEPMLIWWQSHKLYYPHHFAAACDLLGAPGSVEGAVERLFGKKFHSLLRTQWKTVSSDILRKLVILRAKSHFK